MHKESKFYMRDAFATHIADLPKGKVLDIGAVGKRPWFREIWETKGGWEYHGLDLAEGPNVDVVLQDPWLFDLPDDQYDAIISGQMLEHNEFFWLTFLEMARVLKMGGMMVHIAPSRGPEHRDPQDCWRWYRDGMEAMAKWSGLELISATTDWAPDHFAYYRENNRGRIKRLRRTMRKRDTVWGDTIGVFRKVTETTQSLGMSYVQQFAERAEASVSGGISRIAAE
ncbi:MAG TPA: methyltransferase domain-containing protein [Aliiroseovarius sp.]|nr:methyltransferase domain-containing protein [Aliiroseovarius sp.]